MSKKKNQQKFSPQAVNPLAAALPAQEIPTSNTEDSGSEESQEETTEGEETIEEIVRVTPTPDEFDPEEEELELPNMNDEEKLKELGFADMGEELIKQMTKETLEPIPSTGVDKNGNPIAENFNPRDTSKGFYKGIDPVTGKRVFATR